MKNKKQSLLRLALNQLIEKGLVKVYSEEILLKHVAELQRENQGTPLFFKKVKGGKGLFRTSFLTGLFSNKKLISLMLNVDENSLRDKLLEAMFSKGKVQISTGDKFEMEAFYNPDLLSHLPILKHYEREKGPYITSSAVIAKDPETGRMNVSIHRMTPLKKNFLVLRVVEGRDLYNFVEKAKTRGENLPVAVIIGFDAALMLSAATSLPGKNELEMASVLRNRPVELVKCETVDAYAPVDAEIILEGEILTRKSELEGPFVEIGGVDVVRRQPILEIKALKMRKDAIYYDILPASEEHALLMGLTKEPLIYAAAKEKVDLVDVKMTRAGMYWLEAVIKIRKRRNGDPLAAAFAAINVHPSLKRVIITDEDVEINNYIEVSRAILTRCYPPMDVYVFTGIPGSSLDHSNIRKVKLYNSGNRKEIFIELPPAKIVVDATWKGPNELLKN